MPENVLTNQKKRLISRTVFGVPKTRPGGTRIERAKLKTVIYYKVRSDSRWRHMQFEDREAALRCVGRALGWSETINAVVIKEASIPAKALRQAA
jgi:hypothetical protein